MSFQSCVLEISTGFFIFSVIFAVAEYEYAVPADIWAEQNASRIFGTSQHWNKFQNTVTVVIGS